MKGLILIMDGMGDRPIKELGNKTPLEAAIRECHEELGKKVIFDEEIFYL